MYVYIYIQACMYVCFILETCYAYSNVVCCQWFLINNVLSDDLYTMLFIFYFLCVLCVKHRLAINNAISIGQCFAVQSTMNNVVVLLMTFVFIVYIYVCVYVYVCIYIYICMIFYEMK